jgi:glycosyltransferase involved in cell wall biosynthesis
VVDDVTGFLVPPDDIRAAVQAIGQAGGLSRSACREHAVDHLDLERSLDAHEELYQRVVDG